MLIGCIEKHGPWWVPRFKATVTELEPVRRGVFTVLVESSEPAWLAAAVLRYQRVRRVGV